MRSYWNEDRTDIKYITSLNLEATLARQLHEQRSL